MKMFYAAFGILFHVYMYCLLLCIALVVEGQRHLWSGYMHSICHGAYPLQSKVRMLPILELNPSDLNCIRQQAGASIELVHSVHNL